MAIKAGIYIPGLTVALQRVREALKIKEAKLQLLVTRSYGSFTYLTHHSRLDESGKSTE
jgi:hypothetical protein